MNSFRSNREQVFDDESLPACPHHRMREQRFLASDSQERMDESAVAHIHLGRLHEALPDVGLPGLKPPNKEEVNQQIDVTSCGPGIHSDVAGKLCCVEQGALVVGEHRPEATKPFPGHAQAELRDVPLEVRPDKVISPSDALLFADRKEASGKAPAPPEPVSLFSQGSGFRDVERLELEVAHPPSCERLARLLEQIHGSRSEEKEKPVSSSVAPGAVDQPRRTWNSPGILWISSRITSLSR